MAFIESMQVTIQPHYTSKPDHLIAEAKITVKIAGEEEYSTMVIMEENDFQSRFHWMLERVRYELNNAFQVKGGFKC